MTGERKADLFFLFLIAEKVNHGKMKRREARDETENREKNYNNRPYPPHIS